jgi:hypothetical protein
VKRFLKEPGHADSYEDLEVNFIPGRNPDLIIYVRQRMLHDVVKKTSNNFFCMYKFKIFILSRMIMIRKWSEFD